MLATKNMQCTRYLSEIARKHLLASQSIFPVSSNACARCLSVSHSPHHKKTLFVGYTSPGRDEKRNYTSAVGTIETDGFFKGIMKKFGYNGKMKYKKTELRLAAVRMFASYFKFINADDIMTELNLPDTFNSWYRIAELHFWLIGVRLSSEGLEGRFLYGEVVKLFWQDIEERIKKIGGISSSDRSNYCAEYAEMFHGSLFAYDEGFLGDDVALAGALWFSLFENKCEDAEKLELMVKYVRKQISHLDTQPHNLVVEFGLVSFLPLYSDHLEDEERKAKLKQICSTLAY